MSQPATPQLRDRQLAVAPAADRAALERCEAIISDGVDKFTAVGLALTEIRESRLYRFTHGSFDAYCRDRWRLTANKANRQISAARVTGIISARDAAAAALGPIGPVPAAEAQARELRPLGDDTAAVRKVWSRAVAAAGDRPATAAQVRQARIDYLAERDERASARKARAAEREQEQRAAYIAEHGHRPDYMALVQRAAWLRRDAAELDRLTGSSRFDYTPDERAELASKLGEIRDLIGSVITRTTEVTKQ